MQSPVTSDKKKAIAFSVAIYGILLLILFFIRFWPPYNPDSFTALAGGGGGGLTVNFGDEVLDLPGHRLTECSRGAGALAQQQPEDVRVVFDEFHEGLHRGADDAATTGNALARLAHQLAQGQPSLVHQRQPQLFHVPKVSIEGGRRYARLSGHFPQAEVGETAVGAELTERRLDQRTPGFFFLLRANTHENSHLEISEAR